MSIFWGYFAGGVTEWFIAAGFALGTAGLLAGNQRTQYFAFGLNTLGFALNVLDPLTVVVAVRLLANRNARRCLLFTGKMGIGGYMDRSGCRISKRIPDDSQGYRFTSLCSVITRYYHFVYFNLFFVSYLEVV